MEGKILAGFLLLIGGGVTLYILYKLMFAIVEPAVTKKLEQQMTKDKLMQLNNKLKLHEQVNTQAVEKTKKSTK